MKKTILAGIWLLFGAALFAQDLTLPQLNRKVIELEKRIQLLEKALAAKNTPSNSKNIKSTAGKDAWRQLKQGMSMEEVKNILGEPDNVSVSGSITTWKILNGRILFYDESLYSWYEP